MKFLIDAQLPPALATALKAAGHDAMHVEDVGLRHAKDSVIWAHALAESRVIVTKDEDFPNRLLVATPAPQIVWLRVPNCSKRQLLRWLLPELPQIVRALEAGNALFEISRR